MLATAGTIAATVENWLEQFERALAETDDANLRALFHADSHWRDLLALTWGIVTIAGTDAIVRELKAHAGRAQPCGFKINPERTPPRQVIRVGRTAIETIFKFETKDGRGSGVLRLTPDAGDPNSMKAWTLHTSLGELRGHEERFPPFAAWKQGVLARLSWS